MSGKLLLSVLTSLILSCKIVRSNGSPTDMAFQVASELVDVMSVMTSLSVNTLTHCAKGCLLSSGCSAFNYAAPFCELLTSLGADMSNDSYGHGNVSWSRYTSKRNFCWCHAFFKIRPDGKTCVSICAILIYSLIAFTDRNWATVHSAKSTGSDRTAP